MGLLAALVTAAIGGCLLVLAGVTWARRKRERSAAAQAAAAGATAAVFAPPLPRHVLCSQVLVVPRQEMAEHEEVEDRGSHRGQNVEADGPAREQHSDVAQHDGPPEQTQSVEWPPAARPVQTPSVGSSAHETPTREFAAYVQELAALSMTHSPTRELVTHQTATREFPAAVEALGFVREHNLDDQVTRKLQGLPPVSTLVSERVRKASGLQPRIERAATLEGELDERSAAPLKARK